MERGNVSTMYIINKNQTKLTYPNSSLRLSCKYNNRHCMVGNMKIKMELLERIKGKNDKGEGAFLWSIVTFYKLQKVSVSRLLN